MKYIRTKDGKLFEYNDDFEKRFQLTWWQKELIEKNEGKFYLDGKNIVYKVADTIEELCDEFVRICERFGIREVLNKKEKKDLLEKRLKTNVITCFYGAIWTPKGLIYVAKMNEKGELELL